MQKERKIEKKTLPLKILTTEQTERKTQGACVCVCVWRNKNK